jgi:nitroimidazol reductase NimA-like FMN-containing flavoprotein (pyridoxamine 5'-phosphate oxidase superfamily)
MSTDRNGTGQMIDRNGMEVLSRRECLRLLQTAPLGRVAVTMSALPAVFPVNFALLDGDVVFETGSGTKLAAALRNAVVAFEVDHIEPISHTGWSVLVTGTACELFDPVDLARARRLPLTAWAPGEHSHFVRISSDLVSGRRLTTELLAGPVPAAS